MTGRISNALTIVYLACGLSIVPTSLANAHAHIDSDARMTSAKLKPVVADVEMLESIGAEVIAREPSTGVGFARISSDEEARLSALSHSRGRCAGFETLPEMHGLEESNGLLITHVFGQLAEQEARNRRFVPSMSFFVDAQEKPEITSAMTEISESNLKATVEFLSAFPNRLHSGSDANRAGEALKGRIEEMLKNSNLKYSIDFISHNNTRQKSLRVSIPGRERPNEIVVLGGHLDSINHDWFGDRNAAPGADDNASGSANLVEALRVLAQQPQRTVEFMWYAGEEGGLLGSSEIASQYKNQGKDVIAVLQLDMTLFPGDGEFTLGSMTDFTSAWLRSYLETLNSNYIKARIVESRCGYGCSDHASWHRQGYPALMPFEATMNSGNGNIHTSRDRIDGRSNFRHSAIFSKIALGIAMDLGNSNIREPK